MPCKWPGCKELPIHPAGPPEKEWTEWLCQDRHCTWNSCGKPKPSFCFLCLGEICREHWAEHYALIHYPGTLA